MPDPNLLEMDLLHFSSRGIACTTSDNPRPGTRRRYAQRSGGPAGRYDWRHLASERKRALQGLAPDPDRDAKIEAILEAFYNEILEPSFNAMRTDCSRAQTLAPMALRWAARVELMGFTRTLLQPGRRGDEAVTDALKNCFNVTKGNCLDTSDPVQMNEAAMYSRQLAIFGVDDPAYNHLNPELHCSLGWTGTASSTAQVEKSEGSGVTDIITTDVQWVIDSANTYPGVQTRYQIKRGSIQWEQKGTDQFGCTHSGGPQSFDLTPEDGEIVVDETNHTYQATGVTMHFTQATVTCPPGQPSYTADVAVSYWLITPVCRSRECNGVVGQLRVSGVEHHLRVGLQTLNGHLRGNLRIPLRPTAGLPSCRILEGLAAAKAACSSPVSPTSSFPSPLLACGRLHRTSGGRVHRTDHRRRDRSQQRRRQANVLLHRGAADRSVARLCHLRSGR